MSCVDLPENFASWCYLTSKLAWFELVNTRRVVYVLVKTIVIEFIDHYFHLKMSIIAVDGQDREHKNDFKLVVSSKYCMWDSIVIKIQLNSNAARLAHANNSKVTALV